MYRYTTQKTRDNQCWINTGPVSQTVGQHRSNIDLNVSCLVGALPANTRHWTNAGLMLAHRLRRRPNINTTLVQFLVFAVSAAEAGMSRYRVDMWTSLKRIKADVDTVIQAVRCWHCHPSRQHSNVSMTTKRSSVCLWSVCGKGRQLQCWSNVCPPSGTLQAKLSFHVLSGRGSNTCHGRVQGFAPHPRGI